MRAATYATAEGRCRLFWLSVMVKRRSGARKLHALDACFDYDDGMRDRHEQRGRVSTVGTALRRFAWSLVCAASLAWLPAQAAMPGVTELGTASEAIPDAVLAHWLGDDAAKADVVAIGESVHGSAGFLKFQARLIRHLVERQGMRLVVWENPVRRSLALSRWADACRRVATPVPLDTLYMPTLADRAFFDWLCAFNRKHPHDPIRFRGIDVWDRPWEHYQVVLRGAPRLGLPAEARDRIARVCPGSTVSGWPEFERLLDEAAAGGFMPRAAYRECRSALDALMQAAARLGLERQPVAHASAEDAFELALAASTLLGWLGFYDALWTDDIASWNERDAAQGRNLEFIMQQARVSRAILAAHTSHVSHNRSPADWWGYGDLKSGVYFLEASGKRRVFTVALTGYDVSGTQGHWSVPVAANSIDRRLHEAGHTLAVFRADAAFLSEHPRWWMQNGNTPGRYESGVEIVARDHFDAFVFFTNSQLDEALPAPPMWRP